MVAKGLDFPRVSVVGIISADTSLTIPDFRASERTFQLIVQVAGRAGRADLPGQVVAQTLHADEPAIRFAAEHDYDAFADWEMPLREKANLPPFSRMVRCIVRHRDVTKAEESAARLAEDFRKLLPPGEVTMLGPQPAPVRKIRNQFRFQILLTSTRASMVQQFILPQIGGILKGIAAEVLFDVDPLQLM